MRMIVIVAALPFLAPTLLAQEFFAGMEAAVGKIEAKEWTTALDALLGLREKAHSDADRGELANRLVEVGDALRKASSFHDAMRACDAAMAIRRAVVADKDDSGLASIVTSVAYCHYSLGEVDRALELHQAALAMRRRLSGDQPDAKVAESLGNVAACIADLGTQEEAVGLYEAAAAIQQRLHGDRDHHDLAASLNGLAHCYWSLGQAAKALPLFEASLAMERRLNSDRDHADVALALNNVAEAYESLDRGDLALPYLESALAMNKRLHDDRDAAATAMCLDNLAGCLLGLGQAEEALPYSRAALAMRERLQEGRDHPDVAKSLGNLAYALQALGRADEALPLNEGALAMDKRLHGDRDNASVATGLGNLACCLASLGRYDKATSLHEAALAMAQRLHGGGDHPSVAASLDNFGAALLRGLQVTRAQHHFEAALAMRQRLYGERDDRQIAAGMNIVARCWFLRGKIDRALPLSRSACDMIDRLRANALMSTRLRQSFFDELKRDCAYECLQALEVRVGEAANGLIVAERSRGRDLLDLLEQQRADPLDEAMRRAKLRGDVEAAKRLGALRSELETVQFEADRVLNQMTRLDDSKVDQSALQARRHDLSEQSDRVAVHQRQLLDERARLIVDVAPVGRVRTPTEIQAALEDGEILLEFTIDKSSPPVVSLVYVVARSGEVEALPLLKGLGSSVVSQALPRVLSHTLHQGQKDQRGRDVDGPSEPLAGSGADAWSRRLFEALIPKELWPRIQSAHRVWIAAHGDLHRLPFELLVTGIRDGQPLYWLDTGPPIAYVQSGSALCWLRQRAKEARDDTTSFDLLAVGDPSNVDEGPEVPEQGALVLAVDEGGEGARVGLRARDVLLRYDGVGLIDDTTLRDVRARTEAAIEDGMRKSVPVPIEVWRRGETLRFQVNPGSIGIHVGKGRARDAGAAAASTSAQLERVARSGELERINRLPPLRGARAETKAIESVFTSKGSKATCLLGAEATEPAVFDMASKAKYLHFACHGIAEDYAGSSFSMLVLSQPQHVLPGDDGLLKLGDLLQSWRGRLASCRLVVLSACRTNVGPTLRDEAPQALPLGFLFAGASAVISSLWAVDDASTRELMTDFYQRLTAGERDRLKAFTEAKKWLRSKYSDPFYWASFLYIGSPE